VGPRSIGLLELHHHSAVTLLRKKNITFSICSINILQFIQENQVSKGLETAPSPKTQTL
jgi:hypothetical protein